MKLNGYINMRRMGGLFAALFAIAMVLSAATPVLAQGANAPTLNVGDSAYFGTIMNIGEEYKAEIDEALSEIENMGFDVKYDANGGAGMYFGWEVMSNSADVNGVTCYDIALMGAVGVDFGIDASVDGTVTEEGYTMTMNGKGDATLKFEATLEGHLYLTVDELAVAKIQLTLKADGNFNAKIDASMSASGMNVDITGKATASIDNVQFDLTVVFDPPIDIYDFPINQGDEWYVPAEETAVSGSYSAKGTVTYDVEATMPGQEPIDESNTTNLATEIGSGTISEIMPGGMPENYYGWETGGGTLFRCTSVVGTTAIIEMDMFGMMDDYGMGLSGTRQFGDFENMMPSMGLQFDTAKGMMTGVAMDGVAMTESTTKTVVDDFIAAPLKTVTAETGGAGGGLGSMMLILMVVIIVVVVIVVVVMVVMKKKTPPAQQFPPQQPMYGPQPGYEQPPPQYTPPQQPDQYGNYPPPQQPDQYGNYPPPPPPDQ